MFCGTRHLISTNSIRYSKHKIMDDICKRLDDERRLEMMHEKMARLFWIIFLF